jgi:hypothetical protein
MHDDTGQASDALLERQSRFGKLDLVPVHHVHGVGYVENGTKVPRGRDLDGLEDVIYRNIGGIRGGLLPGVGGSQVEQE